MRQKDAIIILVNGFQTDICTLRICKNTNFMLWQLILHQGWGDAWGLPNVKALHNVSYSCAPARRDRWVCGFLKGEMTWKTERRGKEQEKKRREGGQCQFRIKERLCKENLMHKTVLKIPNPHHRAIASLSPSHPPSLWSVCVYARMHMCACTYAVHMKARDQLQVPFLKSTVYLVLLRPSLWLA